MMQWRTRQQSLKENQPLFSASEENGRFFGEPIVRLQDNVNAIILLLFLNISSNYCYLQLASLILLATSMQQHDRTF